MPGLETTISLLEMSEMATEFCRKKSFVTDWCWQSRPARRERQTPRAPCIVEEPLGCINPYLWAPTDKVPSQATCCSLENPITDCRGTLGNTPPGNLSPSARITDRTSSSFTVSSAHSASLSFTLTDLVSLSCTLLSPLSVFVSLLPHLSLLFFPCLVLPILSFHRPPPQSLCISMF